LNFFLFCSQSNKKIVHVNRNGQIIDVLWEDISIGDIVQLSDNDTIPCDMVILSTSQEQNQCYVQTSNLDGETSLKTKVASPLTKKLKSIEKLNQFLGKTSTETTQTSSNKSTIDVSFQFFFLSFFLA
jgi:P-type E1-E2 ATPase